jgi:hypothetical protein
MEVRHAFGIMKVHFDEYDHAPEVNEAFETLKPIVLAQLSHNTGSPKLPPCEECGSVAITNALFELGERFCKYCGRQLRASA